MLAAQGRAMRRISPVAQADLRPDVLLDVHPEVRPWDKRRQSRSREPVRGVRD